MMRTKDGEEVLGSTVEERVDYLREISHSPQGSRSEFMQVAAAHAGTQTGKHVRSTCAEDFVNDLIAAGLLYIEEGE